VFVRLKPVRQGDACIRAQSGNSILISDGNGSTSFACNGVFTEDMTRLVSSHNPQTLIMSYGHSGSGKTYTMFGPGGVVETILADLNFSNTCCSFLEVYNEKVYDLLVDGITQTSLALNETRDHQLVVRNLTSVRVGSAGELLTLVDIGLRARVSGENGTHARSSRSHAIFQISLPNNRSIWLADLAGSEKHYHGHPNPMETSNIHKSLHALKRCIMAIRKRDPYIPARSSVLTRLLFSRPNTHCMLVACIDPSTDALSESINTIEFAATGAQVKQWQSGPPAAPDLRESVFALSEQLREERQWREKMEKKLGMRPTPSPTGDNQVLSATWRQSKYDEVLDRCWFGVLPHE
jgi:hypothetical protein